MSAVTRAAEMPTELDHIFMCASHNADEADRLTAIGLTEVAANSHPGQGTACRRFFFRNAYLELLWVRDSAEAQSDLVQRICLWERWKDRSDGACPFGFGLRPAAQRNCKPPFPIWVYRPPYLTEPLSIGVGSNSDQLTEPLLFYLPFAKRPDSYPGSQRQPMDHSAGLREITRVELVSPHADDPSRELKVVIHTNLLRLRTGTEHLVELGFDGEQQGRKTDFRPALPLIFCW